MGGLFKKDVRTIGLGLISEDGSLSQAELGKGGFAAEFKQAQEASANKAKPVLPREEVAQGIEAKQVPKKPTIHALYKTYEEIVAEHPGASTEEIARLAQLWSIPE